MGRRKSQRPCKMLDSINKFYERLATLDAVATGVGTLLQKHNSGDTKHPRMALWQEERWLFWPREHLWASDLNMAIQTEFLLKDMLVSFTTENFLVEGNSTLLYVWFHSFALFSLNTQKIYHMLVYSSKSSNYLVYHLLGFSSDNLMSLRWKWRAKFNRPCRWTRF